jgi:hypothetical protein
MRSGGVITRAAMMLPMLEACPSFQQAWDEFVEEWKSEAELPLYLGLSELARHLIARLEAQDAATLSRAFAVVERWHLEGDDYVRDAATIGLLEDLQNGNLHVTTTPQQFEPLLLPASLKAWRELELSWNRRRGVVEVCFLGALTVLVSAFCAWILWLAWERLGGSR